MGLFENFPYTNFHELNLDWIVNRMKEVSDAYKTLSDIYATLPESAVNYLISSGKLLEVLKPYMPPLINVKMLGAKGDGVADDTDAIQKALDKYHAIYIPEGTYKVTSISFDTCDIIVGENPNSSVIDGFLKSKNYDDDITSRSPGGPHDAVIANIGIITGGLRVYGYRNYFSRLYIHKCTQGFVSQWCDYLGGVAETDEGNVGFMESIVEKCRFYNNGIGVFWKGPHDSIFNDCWFYLNNTGMILESRTGGSNSYTATACVINNCHFYANKYIGYNDKAGCYLLNSQVESTGYNIESAVASQAVAVSLESGCRVVNCFIFSNTAGTALNIGGSGNYIKGAYLFNNAVALYGYGKNNYVEAFLQNNTITHETFALDKTNFVKISGQLSQYSMPPVDIINKTIPASADSAHKVVNDTGSTVIVYQRGQGSTFVVHGSRTISCQAANSVILENGDSIFYNDAVPADWTWVPVNIG